VRLNTRCPFPPQLSVMPRRFASAAVAGTVRGVGSVMGRPQTMEMAMARAQRMHAHIAHDRRRGCMQHEGSVQQDPGGYNSAFCRSTKRSRFVPKITTAITFTHCRDVGVHGQRMRLSSEPMILSFFSILFTSLCCLSCETLFLDQLHISRPWPWSQPLITRSSFSQVGVDFKFGATYFIWNRYVLVLSRNPPTGLEPLPTTLFSCRFAWPW
jgi:hypothetical protein